MGTVYEVINGTTGLPGVQIAIYPYGSTARFLKSFGAGQVNTFYSFYHQVFSETIPLDVMKCGNNFALGLSSTGIGSNPFSVTKKCWREKRLHQKYEITIDGQRIYEECLSILILNAPFNGDKMLKTACQIQPDDGKLDLFIVKRLPHVKLLSQLLHYLLFKYKSYPEFIMHETGRHIQITSKEMQHCRIDGELHYETTMDYRLLPLAIDFVNPLSEGGPSL